MSMPSLTIAVLLCLCLFSRRHFSKAFTMGRALTKAKVADTIDEIVASTPNVLPGLSLRQAKDEAAWKRILGYAKSGETNLQSAMTPWFFGMEILDDNDEICGFVTFNVAFSSWNGKILHQDQLQHYDMTETMEQQLLRELARMAVKMGFARLTWTHIETPEWHKNGNNRPEMHSEVLTLCMDRNSMSNYVSEYFPAMSIASISGPFQKDIVRKGIRTVLEEVNLTIKAGKFQLKQADVGDTETVSKLVQGLANYVKEPEAVLLSGKDYQIDGFSSEPLFYCLIIEAADEDGEMHPCGFAFFFFGYQLGKGRFMHLEDLFIESKHRQNGGGSLVMATLAKISQSLELSNFYWQALDWNTSALAFYEKLGAKVLDGVKTSRYCSHPSDALRIFAEEESGE